jgi:hypothetical protein
MKSTLSLVRTLALVVAAGALFAAPAAHAQSFPSAQQVVSRYTAAIGGDAAIERVQHRHMRAEMTMVSAGMTMSMEIWQSRPDRILMVMEIPGIGQMRQGHDGETAWSSNYIQGPRILQGEEAQQQLRQADFDANLRFDHVFPTMEMVGRAELQGRPCDQVRMVAEDGDETVACFDLESGLLLGLTSMTRTERGRDESRVEFHDYRDFGGLRVPTRTVVTVGNEEMVMTVLEMDTDQIPASMYRLPPEVAALRP